MEVAKVQAEPSFSPVIRAAEQTDFHFILSAWLQSYRVVARAVRKEDYYAGQQNLIAELGKRRRLLIACEKEQPAYIYGFLCGTAFTSGRVLVDYVFVKKLYRRQGVASALLDALGFRPAAGGIATHLTPAVSRLLRGPVWAYNPYYNSVGYSDV